jgi:protein-tyrosine-phosphatase
MAESIFRSAIEKRGLKELYSVSSAGLSVKVGEGMNEQAKAALGDLCVKPHRHKARVLTKNLIARASLIVCMTDEHKRVIRSEKALTVGEITGRGNVPDPYGLGRGEYLAVADYLLSSLEEILIKAKEFAEKLKIKK